MILGTNHFADKVSAIRYYGPYINGRDNSKGATKELVEKKLASGEIKFGPPPCRHDETAFLDQNEGRWFKRIDG